MSWIKVRDQEPPTDTWIIYHAPNIFSADASPQMWFGMYNEGVFYNRQGFFGGGEVTHWMYPPKLPTGETDCESTN